jgi:hypothetical protein
LHVQLDIFAVIVQTQECITPTTGTSLPSPGNVEQATFVLATRCGHAPTAPGPMKVRATVQLSNPANGGLLLTILRVIAQVVTIKINTQHSRPANRALWVTTVPNHL